MPTSVNYPGMPAEAYPAWLWYACKNDRAKLRSYDPGEHIIFVNEAGSVHFTRYKDGRTSPMVDPMQAAKVEYAEGYLENRAARDASYRSGLEFLRNGPPKRRGFLAWLFGGVQC